MTTEVAEPTEPPNGVDRAGWRELAVVLLGPALGVFVAWVVLNSFVLPAVGYPKDAARVIAISQMLDQHGGKSAAYVIGNSVGVEGIDAAIVEEVAGGDWAVRNISCNGLGFVTIRAMLPKILRTDVGTIFLVVGPREIDVVHPPHPDRAYALAIGGFVGDASGQEFEALREWVDEGVLATMYASDRESKLHFRLAPLNIFNEKIRAYLRGGLRSMRADEWVAPYELAISISGRRLDRHLEETGRTVDEAIRSEDRSGARLLREIASLIHNSGTRLILVVPGLHPSLGERAAPLRQELAALCEELSEQYGAEVVDLTGHLQSEWWADAVHLNEDGRRGLSESLGRSLGGSRD